MTSPCVSVVMPVYNGEKHLRMAMTSVLAQTLREVELVVVDDGSTDGSGAIAAELAASDSRVTLVRQPNGGVAAARNAGLAAAHGRYLMFCDADDSMEADACRRMVEALESATADAVVCRCRFIADDGADSYEMRIGDGGYFNGGRPGLVSERGLDRLTDVNVVLWNKIYRLDLIRRFGIRFPAVVRHEDDAFWFQYALVGCRVLRIPDVLYRYRVSDASLTAEEEIGNDRSHRGDRLTVLRHVVDFAVRNGVDASASSFFVRQAYRYALMMEPLYGQEEFAAVRRELYRLAEPYFGTRCRLVDTGRRLVRIDRRGTPLDFVGFCWWRLQTRLRPAGSARRRKAVDRAERSWLTWKNR